MKEVIGHLIALYKNFKVLKTKITIDGLDYNAQGFIKLLHSMPEIKPHLEAVLLMSDSEKLNWCREVWNGIDEAKRLERQEENQREFTARLSRQFTLYSDWKSGRKVVYDRINRKISDMHPDTFLDNLNAWQRKAIKEEGISPCMEVFDPYKLQNYWTDSSLAAGQEVVVLNAYQPPPWRVDASGNYKDKLQKAFELPNVAKEFFDHLFPDAQQRRFVFWWIHTAMTGRNMTYLCLNGRKGVGKGLFSEILKRLMGDQYSSEAPVNFLDSTFNGVLENKRFILLDEIRISDQDQANRLKRYANKMQNIEKKGIEADKSTETFTNFLISNNDLSDMYLEWDDRRFSVADISTERLDKVWGDAKCDSFATLIEEDDDFIAQLGFFFLYGVKSDWFPVNYVLKGERFWQIVDASMPQWQKHVIQFVMDKKEARIEIKDIIDDFKKKHRMTIRTAKIADFINNYRDRNGDSLGSIEQEESLVLVCNPKFVEETDTNSSDDVGIL